MSISRREFVAVCLASLLPGQARAAEARFDARVFDAPGGLKIPYRLFTPSHRAGPWPVILWLHGAGGRGSDNVSQISGGNALGATMWASEPVQKHAPAVVIAPQCPHGKAWASMDDKVMPTAYLQASLALLDHALASLPIDRTRIYTVGQSMGGFGAWALAAEYPDKFAGIVPICGGGDLTKAAALASTPAWAFHGALDDTVPVRRSRDLIQAVEAAGGAPRYTEYASIGHLAWEVALREPELVPWLFGQRRRT